ncbi:MAG: sigma-70 family RNA polymerase sigma factor, partial [Acidimicrobiia bacterium]
LLVAAGAGDRDALEAAVRASQADVWRLARNLVGDADADDVTQETFVRAWRALPGYRAEASGRTWLLAIARRTCADALRRRYRRRRTDQRARTDAAPSPPSDPGVIELVAKLEPDRREAFVLTQLLGCSYAEAAEVCGVPVGTIRSRVARARDDLIGALRAAESA